ncbi:MAG: outer rane adhesin like protein [Gemmatimonadetes bacterium]|nr:outer rane adhesin like protein [Gemmatimonadota bacterium]
MPRLMHLTGAAAVLLAFACSEPTAPSVAPDQGPAMTIADAAHAGGPSHFYFLPPVVKAPAAFSGTFDAALSPRVEVCQLSGAVCGATVATFVSGGSGPDAVKLDAGGQKYHVNFQTQRYSLDPSRTYRITVFSGAVPLGYADLKVVRSGGDQKNVDPEQYAVVKNGSTLPISFRIEQGIAGAVVVSPALDTIPVGQTAQFTATVTDLHGAALPGAPVTWSASPAAVATIDATGLATGVAIGTATVTATSGGASGSATLVVKTPNHPPVAVSDTFQAIGNVTVPIAAPGVLAHDTDPDGNALSAVAGTFPTAGGGTVTVAADGSLSYLSAPGFTGTDSAAYVVTDGAAADTAQVVFNVPTRVWYVRNTAAAPGDGRDASPFATLAAAEGASAAGETIFLLFGDVSVNGLDAGFTFKPGQSLIGQGVSSPVIVSLNGAPLVLLAAGMAPTVGRASAGAAVQLATGNTLRGLGVASSAGAGVAGSGFGSFIASEVAVGATGGPGVDLSVGSLAVALSNVSSNGSAGAGLRLSAVSGTFTAAGGSIGGAAGAGVDLAGGDADVSYAGSVSSTAGRSVSVVGRTGGTVDLSGAISDDAGGVLVQGNSGGTVQLTGSSKTLSTGASNGVTLAGNGGTTVRFGGGGLNVTTTTGTAFSATGGGTVIVTGPHNVLSAAGGAALSVLATDVGSGGLTFESVSADGGVNGIVLNGTGAVSGLLVTGNGSAGSGGTIRNMVGADGTSAGVGIYLASTRGAELHSLQLNGFSNFAVRGVGIDGFTLASSTVSGMNGTSAAGEEGSLSFSGLTGAAAVVGSSVSGGLVDNLRVANGSGVLDRLVVTGSVFGPNDAVSGRDGVRLEASGSARLNATVQGSAFNGARANLLTLDLRNGGLSDVVLQGNTFNDAQPGILPGAGGVVLGSTGPGAPTLTYLVDGNTFRGALGAALSVAKGAGTGSFSGTLSSNVVGASGVPNSGSAQGSGLSLVSVGGGSFTVLASGNQIRQYNNQGILLQTGDAAQGGNASLNATLVGNTIAEPGTAAIVKNGINLNSGTATGDAHQVCLAMSGNSLAGSGSGGAAGTDFRLRQRFLTTVRLPGYAGGAGDNAAVVAFEQGQNAGSPTGSAANTVSTGGPGFLGGGGCAQP